MTFFGIKNIGVGQTPGTTFVTSSNTQIVAANADRIAIVLTNVGSNEVWVACDVTAEIVKGFLLAKHGGTLFLDSTCLTLGKINGITAAGGSFITFQEFNQS